MDNSAVLNELLTKIFSEKSDFKILQALKKYVQCKGSPDGLQSTSRYNYLYVEFFMEQHGFDPILLPFILEDFRLQFKYFDRIPLHLWFDDPSLLNKLSDDFKQFAFEQTGDSRFELNATDKMFFDINTHMGIISKAEFRNKRMNNTVATKRIGYEGEFLNPYAQASYTQAMERLTEILSSPEWDAYVATRPKNIRGFFNQLNRHFCDEWMVPALRPLMPLFARHSFLFDSLFSGYKLSWDVLCYLPLDKGPSLSFSLPYTFEGLVTALEVKPELYDILPSYMHHLKKIRSFDSLYTHQCDFFKMEEVASRHPEFAQWWNKAKNKLLVLPPYASFPSENPVLWENYMKNDSLVRRYRYFSEILGDKAAYCQKVVNHTYDMAYLSGIYMEDMVPQSQMERVTVTEWLTRFAELEQRYQHHLAGDYHVEEAPILL